MKNNWVIGIFISFLMISGCTVKYEKPTHVGTIDKYSVTINKEFDQVWKELIEYSASTFFAIDNFEKDSGLIILTFGSSNPTEFITGGHIKSTGTIQFEGDYVDYLNRYYSAKLTGRMNIVVTKISNEETQVTVNSRYIYTALVGGGTWSFQSGNCDTQSPIDRVTRENQERTICPTYKAENAILNALK